MKKVAVVNRTNLINYGSLLQSYALCEKIKELGYDSEIIWEKGSISDHNDFRIRKIIQSICKLVFHPKLIKKTFSLSKSVAQHV
ncbi:MAG: hypothetical protein KBS91_04535, partial [Firmicutes bacterium]|nr:hypothetical protein [Candidatus Caballimonas caccae]